MADLTPKTRKEKFLAKAGGQEVTVPAPPLTREEMFLQGIIDASDGGGFTPTQAQLDAMNSGIDSTKVAQIATNTSDISDIQDTIGDINSVLEEVL